MLLEISKKDTRNKNEERRASLYLMKKREKKIWVFLWLWWPLIFMKIRLKIVQIHGRSGRICVLVSSLTTLLWFFVLNKVCCFSFYTSACVWSYFWLCFLWIGCSGIFHFFWGHGFLFFWVLVELCIYIYIRVVLWWFLWLELLVFTSPCRSDCISIEIWMVFYQYLLLFISTFVNVYVWNFFYLIFVCYSYKFPT